jgi:hypothetical protein
MGLISVCMLGLRGAGPKATFDRRGRGAGVLFDERHESPRTDGGNAWAPFSFLRQMRCFAHETPALPPDEWFNSIRRCIILDPRLFRKLPSKIEFVGRRAVHLHR